MAISTYQTYLMHGTGTGSTTMSKLIDIVSFPNLGGDPETIDVTTLSDKMRVFILGIQSSEMMSFETNYDLTKYNELKALEGEEEQFAVWFGGDETGTPDGSKGKFGFKGQLAVHVNGGGVNEAVKMTVSIAPTTIIEVVV